MSESPNPFNDATDPTLDDPSVAANADRRGTIGGQRAELTQQGPVGGADMDLTGRPSGLVDAAPALLTLRPRQRLGKRFEIVRPLGKGGMGAVYLAHDLVLERDVAIKTLRTNHLDPRSRRRWLQTFRREATSTAALQHPNITTLHDFGVEDGLPYMVLESLRGETLSNLLKKGPLTEDRAVGLMRQLADALDHAHRHDVIHRDIKPGNLFIEAGDRLKIMDFGIAMLRADQDTLSERFDRPASQLLAHLGRAPSMAGTPRYMAPEQMLGWVHDARVDLWAAGIVFYEMLSGQRPFENPMQALS